MKTKLKKLILNWLIKDLLKVVTEEDVLRTNEKGGIIYRGRVLEKDSIDVIKREAEILENSQTLKLLLLDMEYVAQKIMFEKSQTYDDMMMGKAVLYTTDVLRKKIKNLAK